MENGERMDIFRKKRSESLRKPRLGGSHTFMNEHDHSSASGSPLSDPQFTPGIDKGNNEDAGKYTNHYSINGGYDYKKKLGNGNIKGRFESVKEDMGRSKSGNRKAAGGGRDDDWDDLKRARNEVTQFSGNNKHKGTEEGRIYDRKHDRGGGLKLQDYDRNRRVEKSSREKIYRDASHHDKNFKESCMGEKVSERDRKFFGETFKRKMRTDDLDVSKRARDAGKERKDSYDRHVSHQKPDRDRDCDQDRERNHDGVFCGRSYDVQGNSKSADGNQRAAAVGGLNAVVGYLDWRNLDGHKNVDRRSSDAHTIGQVKGVPDSGHGAGHSSLQDDGRNSDGPHTGQSKSANFEFNAPEGLNVAQVKTPHGGNANDMRESLDKSILGQDGPHPKENRTTMVKLKVSGATHTMHASLASRNKQKAAEGSSAFARPPQVPEGGRRRQRLILQENSDDEDDYPPRAEKCLQESFRKESAANCAAPAWMDMDHSKEDRKNKVADENTSGNQVEINNFPGNQPVRKSTRIPKKRVLDGEIDEDGDTEEATHRKNWRIPKKRLQNGEYDDSKESETVQRKRSRIPKKRMRESEYDDEAEENGAHYYKRKQKKFKSARDAEDLYEHEEEVDSDRDLEHSDIEPEVRKNIKRKETLNSTEEKKEIPLTARQRAMQSSKDVDAEVGANLIEFPEGLPHSGQRRKKEKLSEVEQQVKKAEAAQRRKQQVERAANAQQAEAIKKILGTDSTRKKKEDKLRKQRDEKEQEKSASAMMLAPNSVRWVMGPSGTIVSFAQDAALPSIFNSAPCRYPPPREKCAGPLCKNTYKYRDSKSNLPLCSLQCYRAIHNVIQSVPTY